MLSTRWLTTAPNSLLVFLAANFPASRYPAQSCAVQYVSFSLSSEPKSQLDSMPPSQPCLCFVSIVQSPISNFPCVESCLQNVLHFLRMCTVGLLMWTRYLCPCPFLARAAPPSTGMWPLEGFSPENGAHPYITALEPRGIWHLCKLLYLGVGLSFQSSGSKFRT